MEPLKQRVAILVWQSAELAYTPPRVRQHGQELLEDHWLPIDRYWLASVLAYTVGLQPYVLERSTVAELVRLIARETEARLSANEIAVGTESTPGTPEEELKRRGLSDEDVEEVMTRRERRAKASRSTPAEATRRRCSCTWDRLMRSQPANPKCPTCNGTGLLRELSDAEEAGPSSGA